MSPRSYLFVPGDRPERFAKAEASGADAVIADLEDAVSPAAKSAARNAVHAALAGRRVVLRVNGRDTPWFDDDARLAAHPGVAAVMLPKTAQADDVAALRARCGDKPVLALVETARGMACLAAIAAAPGVDRLVFGSVDFQLDMDIEDDDEALRTWRAHLVLASRVAGLAAPVDGVTVSLDDAARIAADARRARAFGFGGKLCIHPRQVALVNAAFTPPPERLDWARRVVAASEAAGGAAVAVDGKMIDAPVLASALRLLRAGAAGPRQA
ncbi:CoA ester lyase [Ideonella sp. B508-1]|uniref:HpcH/HpaI aldolase/citrate lyase family protein n=1 Tax=Ideonella sp. B508-1 TaxID=137716 RepID=UPI00034508BE|nr:CoA ester lyase [Ideonella sp. B508-1]